MVQLTKYKIAGMVLLVALQAPNLLSADSTAGLVGSLFGAFIAAFLIVEVISWVSQKVGGDSDEEPAEVESADD